MPYISIRVAGTLTKEQKQEIAKQVTQTMKDVAQKPEAATSVVFDEVPRENWAKSGQLLA
jgi:4-oxalocrotonate tautomerase